MYDYTFRMWFNMGKYYLGLRVKFRIHFKKEKKKMCKEGDCIADIGEIINNDNLANYEMISQVTAKILEYHSTEGKTK